jgi:hypothetical protein
VDGLSSRLSLASERRKDKPEHENYREPDHPHGHLVRMAGGSLAERWDAHQHGSSMTSVQRRISLLSASARLNSILTTDHVSALQRVCSITRRTRLIRSQWWQGGRRCRSLSLRPAHKKLTIRRARDAGTN